MIGNIIINLLEKFQLLDPSVDLIHLLSDDNHMLTNSVSEHYIQYPIKQNLLEKLQENFFKKSDGVLYPLKQSSDKHFYKSKTETIENYNQRVALDNKPKISKKKSLTFDEQIKKEVDKLIKSLHPEKVHESLGFSKVQRIFGYLRFSQQPTRFYFVDISRDYFELDEKNYIEIGLIEKQQIITTKDCLESEDYNSEPEIISFLKTLPEKSTILYPDFSKNPKMKESYFKLFMIGTNKDLSLKSKCTNFLVNYSGDYPNKNILLGQSNNKLKSFGPNNSKLPKMKTQNEMEINTKKINHILLRQFLVEGVILPNYRSESDLTEEKLREIQVEYQNWGLKEGQFFDGFLFRDEFGAPFAHHPGKHFRVISISV